MGREAHCTARIGRAKHEGRALLETAEVIFRGDDVRVVVPFATITSIATKKGRLTIEHAAGTLALDLGDDAEKWETAIRSPKSRIDKLGVKAGHHVSVAGIEDREFARELAARTEHVHTGRIVKGSDIVFLGARNVNDLGRLTSAARSIARDGAIWVVWPKGWPRLKEDNVRSAGNAVGLVDVKVVAFSDVYSALKLVIPVANR